MLNNPINMLHDSNENITVSPSDLELFTISYYIITTTNHKDQ